MQPPTLTTQRAFSNDDDWWRVRNLLIDAYPTCPPQWNWEIRRWEGWRWHDADITWQPRWETQVRLWQTDSEQVVGAVHPDGESGEFALQLHPNYRHLQPEMLAWAEANLAAVNAQGQKQVTLEVFDYDASRQLVLTERGYTRTPYAVVTRRLRFRQQPLLPVNYPAGYTYCTIPTHDSSDSAKIAALLNAAFNRTFHSAAEFANFARFAPSFRADLHLVAVAPNGDFAAHVGVFYDAVNQRGIFEPVCTHPEHQRHGLASALMRDGLGRLAKLGAREVYVDTGGAVAANALYSSMGFTEFYSGATWQKTL